MTPVQVGQRPLRLPSFGPSCQNSTSSNAGRFTSLQRKQNIRPGPQGRFRLALRRLRKSIRSMPRTIAGKQSATGSRPFLSQWRMVPGVAPVTLAASLTL